MNKKIEESDEKIINSLDLNVRTNNRKLSDEEINGIINKIKAISVPIYDMFHDEDSLFKNVNELDNVKIEKLLKTYSEDKCAYKNKNNVVRTLRYIILKELQNGGRIDKDFIENIKNKIVSGDTASLNTYFKNQEILNTITSVKKDAFNSWKTPYSVCFRFFFNDDDKALVENGYENINKAIVSDLELLDTNYQIVSFLGTRNFGSESSILAIYPQELENYKNAYQLCVKTMDGKCLVGVHKGLKCVGSQEDNNVWHECRTYEEIKVKFKKLIDDYNGWNFELINNVTKLE